MANKDGIVSIGFDYKKELDEVCATIEKELNNLGGDINLSDGIKKQMAEIKKMITDMKKDIGSSFDKITETKLDTKTFESFKKDVNKRIREINKEVTTLKEQFSTLDGSANVSGIVQQFANLKKYVEDSNASISEFISNSEKLGKSVIISPNLNTDTLKNDVVEIRKLLTDLNKEDLDFGYTNKSTKELTNDLEGLVDKYYRITDLIDEMKTSMNGMDATTQEYKNQQVQLSKLSLELIKCSAQIDDLFGAKNAEKINVDKIISIDELDDIFTHVKGISSKIKLEAKNIVESIELSNTAVKNVSNNATSDLSNKSNIEVHISTKQSTINKQLDEMIDNLQQRATNKPIIAPVKLRVDSEYEKTTKDVSASALTENQINEARKDVENVVPGLEKAFNNSMRIATNKAVENAKKSIKAVREFFETNPITVHLTVPEDERLKIGKSILSEDGKTTVDISGQVDKARKSVKGLSEDLEKSQLLIKENAQNAKNLSLEKLVNSLSETMTQFSELKGIISSIQNMESTIARASGISSTNELVEQWSVVEKTIINATKLDGDFRKNANIGKIVSEYQKYIDMGGTNALSSIDKIKDNETTIDSILSKMKELKSQDVENDSIQKLSVDLDGVIAKFDELISTVKAATNALYKIIKQGSVSDLDKQWSSISNKFKSIADESGKINLNKQKTDIKELMDMYQRYENAGGTNSLMSLTDNVETLRKLDKEYQKLNQTQSVDNSSTIEKESESFKNVKKSVDSLTTAIGNTKVQAINVEATAMEDAAKREIIAIRSILDNLDLVVSRLKDIKGIKLPKIEVKNVDVVEKAVESLENAGNKSNILSENGSVIEQQIKEQNDLQNEIRETIALTNEYGEVIDVYRGTRGLIGNGNVSNRYHGGTFWTSNRNLATQSYADGNKVTHANLYMQNPYLVHGGGAEWDQLVLSIKQGEELEKHLETVYTSINDIFTKIQNTSGIEAGHLFDVFNGQLNFTDFENGIQKPIESLKDFQSIFESIDYDGSKIPQVQNYINQLYDLFTSYSRISELSEKGILNTNEITEIAKALKYDGVVFKGIFDGIDEPSDVFVTFEEKQSKVIDMITAAQLRAEEEQSIASMLVDTRKNFYETLKSLSSEQIDSFVDKSAFNFVTDGSYIESLGEVLRNADPTESIDNIKNKIREYINDVVNEFENAQKQISSIETPIKDVFQGDDKATTDASTTAIKEESQALEQVSTSAKDAASSKEKFAKANKEVKASADSSKTSISEEEKYFNSLGKSLTQYQNTLTSISRKPADGNRSQELQEKIDIISSSIEKLNALKSKTEENGYIFNKNDVDTGKQLEETIKKNIELVKQMSAAQKGSDALSRGKEIDTITKYLNKFTGISKQARRELNGLLDQLQSGDPSVNVKKIHERFLELTVAERNAGREARNLFDIFKDKKIYSFLGQAASMFSFYDLVNVGREIVTNIKEVDTALTELRKVSDATEQRLTTNFKNSADTAKELGATVSDVISATADWSRMGYNIDQSEELARVSTLYKNVGDGIDIETANNSLISTLQGFQLDASEAESIIDKFNEVANNYAIDSAGIGEALQRSAASFNAANTDLSKSIALITATNEVVQDPDSVGTLWKTMSARIRGAETELEELGEETDEYTKTTSKLRDLIQSLTGFDIMIDEDTFKDVYEIILGIGKEWDNLTDVEQASLGEALAGKRNANALYAVLGNLDTLQAAYETAENSAGSAMREQENYEKSIQYSLDRLSASAQEWSNTLVSSDVVKWFVDLANAAVELSTALTPLGTIGLGAGITGITKFVKSFA